MTDNELNKMLKAQAIGLGLCEEWTEGWGNPGQQELIGKFLHGIDFCIGHDWPSASFIENHFDKGILHKNQIFTNEEVQLKDLHGEVVFNGNCKGMVLAGGVTVCDLYVRHDCELTVDCKGMSKVFINVYDRAQVKVLQRDAASVYVYLHGDGCQMEGKGDVMTRKSE